MKTHAFVAVITILALTLALSLVVPSSLSAKVVCTNTWNIGTLVMITTPSDPAQVTLTFVEPGFGNDADVCTLNPAACVTLPCAQNDYCLNLPYNTRSCLTYLVSRCGESPPQIRQVNFLYDGECHQVSY